MSNSANLRYDLILWAVLLILTLIHVPSNFFPVTNISSPIQVKSAKLLYQYSTVVVVVFSMQDLTTVLIYFTVRIKTIYKDKDLDYANSFMTSHSVLFVALPTNGISWRPNQCIIFPCAMFSSLDDEDWFSSLLEEYFLDLLYLLRFQFMLIEIILISTDFWHNSYFDR